MLLGIRMVSVIYTPNQPSYSSSYLFEMGLEILFGDFLNILEKKVKNLFMGKIIICLFAVYIIIDEPKQQKVGTITKF